MVRFIRNAFIFFYLIFPCSVGLLMAGGCLSPNTGGSTTQPVANNSATYLAAQVQYWQRIVTALQTQLDAPGAPDNPRLRKDLDTAKWWLNWFSLALAVAQTPGA